MKFCVSHTSSMQGVIQLPGDKSISHRSLMFNALAGGEAHIHGLLQADDVFSTIRCLRDLGVFIQLQGDDCFIRSQGFYEPVFPLYCGNSGTTMRLLPGLLSRCDFPITLSGDSSLSQRPMARIIEPLGALGLQISGSDGLPPVRLHGSKDGVGYFEHQLKVPSAQVKSALMLAALQSNGGVITGGGCSRDHSERMLSHMGGNIQVSDDRIVVSSSQLKAADIVVPGDFSSAAFLLAAVILVGGRVECKSLGLNPTRLGFLHCLRAMGANIEVTRTWQSCGETIGDLTVVSERQNLQAINLLSEQVPSMIDELPLLAVLATQAEGRTTIRGAQELRVKESDRLRAVCVNLRQMGVNLQELPDGLIVDGPQQLYGATLSSFSDHRIAMSFAIAGLVAEGNTVIEGTECVEISFPRFHYLMKDLQADIRVLEE